MPQQRTTKRHHRLGLGFKDDRLVEDGRDAEMVARVKADAVDLLDSHQAHLRRPHLLGVVVETIKAENAQSSSSLEQEKQIRNRPFSFCVRRDILVGVLLRIPGEALSGRLAKLLPDVAKFDGQRVLLLVVKIEVASQKEIARGMARDDLIHLERLQQEGFKRTLLMTNLNCFSRSLTFSVALSSCVVRR